MWRRRRSKPRSRAGKHVVTANKALLAHHGASLAALAEKNHVALNFEGAVAGGIPVVKVMRESLQGNAISRVYGILNGTCNYILTLMEQEGRSFADVLKEAQAQGYAEADPTFDIGGFDTAHKLSLLTSLAFGTRTSFESVYVEGIEQITPADIEAAGDLGYRIKLLGVALRTDSGIEQRVHPTMVPKHTAIAEVDGVKNCVAIDGDFVGDVMLIGAGAGGGRDRVLGDERPDRYRARADPAAVRHQGQGAEALQEGADARARGRLLYQAVGLRPDRRLCRHRQPHGGPGHLHREHRAAPAARRAAGIRPPA